MEAYPFGKSVVKSFTLCLAASLVLGLSGCKKPVASEAPEETAPTTTVPAPTPSPSATATNATSAPAAAAPAPASTPELAPPGVFYLIAAAHAETSDGIVGLPPGTGVKLVRPGIYQTPAGEVPLDSKLLTNDMGVARRAAAQEKNKQSTLQQQRLAAETAAAASSQVAAQPVSTAGQTASYQPQLPPQMAQPPSPQLDAAQAARKEINRQLEENVVRSQRVNEQLNPFVARFGSVEYAAKKSPQAFQLVQQLNALEAERQNLQLKMSQIQ